ncbi:hypothetical protein GMST_04230 [Geomonas silvestris]|uniref:Capsule synthesis protein CapA domain-containing protein n=1 Tax=Geomonas silvestris TaxID=2740184 RepID=A0A6V8MDL0_9BACT|nr:CapA family protein [Geomonas silvestris]GFO58098.1 hypothetical protein GMST_04230 [Geomonas silvestris]
MHTRSSQSDAPRTFFGPHATLRHLRRLSFLAVQLFVLFASSAGADAAALTVAAVGDVMMGSDFPAPRLPKDQGRSLLAPAAPLFQAADLALANLEGPLFLGGDPTKEPLKGRRYLFRTPPSYAQNLKRAGISFVSLANNHALDFGRDGLRSTKQALGEAGVAYAGKSGPVAEFEVRGLKVAVLALGFGAPPRSIVYPERALAEVAEIARRCDILILSVHAGAEGRGALHVAPGPELFLDEPRGDLVRFAHAAIDRGAALVIGHGPHVPRALELYKGRLIAYSLGNFATYGGVSVVGESGYAPLLTVELARDGSFEKGRVTSFLQGFQRGPVRDLKQRALRLMRRLSAEDFPGSPLSFGPDGEFRAARQP